MNFLPTDIASFAKDVLGVSLYPYQREVAEAILTSICERQGRIFTVMMARQSGKNQLSAVLEAFLLTHMGQGTIVKAAPTFKPQIMHSHLRLMMMLNQEALRERLWQGHGHMIGLAPADDPQGRRNHAGPRVMFFSAAPESNVVGATADLLLEIDEAQDVTTEKFDRDFRPMASTTNAATVLYGTAWSDTTLLAQQRVVNLEQERRTGVRQHFEYDWRVLAAINPAYRAFVEQEIARLGEDHTVIQTQYLLRSQQGMGYFFDQLQQTLLEGRHLWEDRAQEGCWYIAGMDVAGSALRNAGAMAQHEGKGGSQRDSTVITIARVHENELRLPVLEVVHQQCWTGTSLDQQYAATMALVERWGLRTLVVDATGIGYGLSALLCAKLGTQRVVPFTFTRVSKSQLAHQLRGLVSSGRLRLYARAGAPREVFDECWKQVRRARYRLPAPEVLDIYVDPADGHDDFLISLALVTEGLKLVGQPGASVLVRPRRLYGEDGRF